VIFQVKIFRVGGGMAVDVELEWMWKEGVMSSFQILATFAYRY
jgi:hypothetical protein